MTSALLSLDILDFLPADQFLFDLDPEPAPAADDAGSAPPQEVADASEAWEDGMGEAPVQLVSGPDAFVFEPLTQIPDASPFVSSMHGMHSGEGPVAIPQIVGGSGAIASDTLFEQTSVPRIVPDLNTPPLISEMPVPTEVALSPDLEGYVGPGPADPEPLNLDLAGYVPPAPPLEEPLFMDVLPGFEEADASAGLLFA